ncbi:MAG: GNAT family N-acetyltransferase [Vulcanimicrobiaceae bacterium]
MIIETPRLRLRGWTSEDIDGWSRMNADPRVMEFFPSAYSPEESASTAATLAERLEVLGYGWWVLEVKDDPRFAGTIALQDIPFAASFTPAKEIGWRLPFQMWGRGYATEGARAVMDYAFRSLGLTEIVAMTAALNVRSQRVMERLGMTHDARDDFEHPRIAAGHPLRRHVLYRCSPLRHSSAGPAQ